MSEVTSATSHHTVWVHQVGHPQVLSAKFRMDRGTKGQKQQDPGNWNWVWCMKSRSQTEEVGRKRGGRGRLHRPREGAGASGEQVGSDGKNGDAPGVRSSCSTRDRKSGVPWSDVKQWPHETGLRENIACSEERTRFQCCVSSTSKAPSLSRIISLPIQGGQRINLYPPSGCKFIQFKVSSTYHTYLRTLQ